MLQQEHGLRAAFAAVDLDRDVITGRSCGSLPGKYGDILRPGHLFADLPQASRAALEASKASRLTIFKTHGIAVITPAAMAFIAEIPRQLEQLRQEHGEAAARAAQLIRLAAVWSVLTAGAVLILAASVIQLVLAYTS